MFDSRVFVFDPRDAEGSRITEAQHIALIAAKAALKEAGICVGLEHLAFIGGTGNKAGRDLIFEVGFAQDGSKLWRGREDKVVNVVVCVKTRIEEGKRVFDHVRVFFELPNVGDYGFEGKIVVPFYLTRCPPATVS